MAFANVTPYGIGAISKFPNTNGDSYTLPSAPTNGDDLYVIFITKHYLHTGADIIATLTSTPSLTLTRQDGAYTPAYSGLAQFECFRATNISPGSAPTLTFTTVDTDSSSHVTMVAFYVSGAASTALICAQLHSALNVSAIPTGSATPTQAAGKLFAVCGIRGGSGNFLFGSISGYSALAADGDATGSANALGILQKANTSTSAQSETFNLTDTGGTAQLAAAGAIGVMIYAEAKTIAGPPPTVTAGTTVATGDSVAVTFSVASTPGSPTATVSLSNGTTTLGPSAATMVGLNGSKTFTGVTPGVWTPSIVATDANGSSAATAGPAVTVVGVAATTELASTYVPTVINASPASLTLTVGAGAQSVVFTDDTGLELDGMLVSGANVAIALPGTQTDSLGSLSVSPQAAGDTSFTVTWVNPATGGSLTRTVLVHVNAAPVTGVAPTWVTASIPNAAAGTSYTAPVVATAAQSYSLVSSPPAWLSINATTGVITGTAPGTPASVSVTVRATNATGSTDRTFTFSIVASPFVAGATLTSGVVGTPYSTTIAAAPASFSVSGLSASGLSMNSAGTISGTPTASGLFTLTATAVTADGTTFTTQYALTILAAISGGGVGNAALMRAIPRPRARQMLAADFAQAFKALMPRGRIWNREPGTAQDGLAQAIGLDYEQACARADYLLQDANPAFTIELLPEWEATLGLPDPCAGDTPTLQARRGQVVARISSRGGQSAAFFVAFAADLGYTITTQNFAPFRAGQSVAGDPVGGEDWFATWAIGAPASSVTYFRAGQSVAGEPLGSWSNAVLECEMTELRPAHSVVQFRYA